MKKLFLAFLVLLFTASYSFAMMGGGSMGGSGGGMIQGPQDQD